MQVFTEQDFLVSNWSGGKTIQLYVYPAFANYTDRNFKLRISIAHVEQDASDFTSLPGFHRKLMVLDGEIQIFHEGYHSKRLRQFESDDFDGAWTTRSIGKCVDFNVMTTPELNSELSVLNLNVGQVTLLETGANTSLFLYVKKGSILIKSQGDNSEVIHNQLLKLDFVHKEELQITSVGKSDLVLTMIQPMI